MVRKYAWALLVLGWTASGWAQSAGDLAAKMSPSDWAVIERSAYGPTMVDVKEYLALGRSAWLERGLQTSDAACLSKELAERVKSLPFNEYDPAASAKAARQAAKEAKAAGDAGRKSALDRESKREPLEEAFEREAIRALGSKCQLAEKLEWFWGNHFSVYGKKAGVAIFLPDYEEQAIRGHMMGKFEDLLWASLSHPAMMIYLDNALSSKGKINENYARELLELHTLGVDGGYNQADVQELAKALTGAGVDLSTKRLGGAAGANEGKTGQPLALANGFLFSPGRHDDGERTILSTRYPKGADGVLQIKAIMRSLALNPKTARRLATKMAGSFVADEPPQRLVEAMAASYLASSGDLGAMTRTMVFSPEYAEAKLSKYKSPREWIYSAMRLQWGAVPPENAMPLYRWMKDLGQEPWGRLTPDGFGFKNSDWESSDQTGKRFELARQIASKNAAPWRPHGNATAPNAKPAPSAELWDLSRRYASSGLAAAISQAKGEEERRAMVLASPKFMEK